MKCYVIHLRSASERLATVKAINAALSVEVVIVDAVDKSTLESNPDRAMSRSSLLSPPYPFSTIDGEIACFLSHRKVWQLIVDGNDDFALVLEDDVQIQNPLFSDQLEFVLGKICPGDIVRFPRVDRWDVGPLVESNRVSTLVRPILPGPQTCAALIGRDAARRLLALTETFDRPIDGFLQMKWVHGISIYAVLPPSIIELGRGNGRSLVQSKRKTLWTRLKREYLRLRYRIAINRAARIFEKAPLQKLRED